MRPAITLLCIFLFGCLTNNTTNITGSYVHESESEYSKSWDTITIKPFNENAGTYLITRKVGFQRIKNDKPLSKVFKKEEWMGEWDNQNQQLTENKKGLVFSLSSSGKELRSGKATFKKLK